ncbi:hypothetical protein V9T40_005388 [Parthenolecanium corni]|uniref:Uncharacterized protein n=1 Tax=Parthenolecanium corni TaxID=536013 RepID=A0AAN9Y398_9HEMI
MKILWCLVLIFAFGICDVIEKKSPPSAIKKNLTALSRIKSQVYKIIDNVVLNNLKKKSENGSKEFFDLKERRAKLRRTKRKVKKENLDDLYPTLFIRSVNVNLDWINFAKNSNASQIGTSLILSDGKSLVTHVMNIGNYDNHYTIPSLEQDRVYRGEIKILTEKEEVKNFIRKQLNRKHVEEFELTTPFIFADEDVHNILETKTLIEAREKSQPLTVKVNYIDIRLSFSKIDKLGYTVEIARYYADGNVSMLSAPDQTIELLPPTKEVVLSDQKPHQLLRVTLKNARENEENGEIYFSTVHAANIFTGNFRVVKCYTDDDVFNGYSCRNSDVCLPMDWVCDGEDDCKGGDDEEYCDNYGGNRNNFYRGECRKYEFRCRARGESVCLPNSWLCDGRRDCSDGWDEDDDNCYDALNQIRPGFQNRKDTYDRVCGRNSFRCWDGRDCVAIRDVCDGTDDCNDGSDERICENWSRSCDSSSEFRCYKSSRPVNSIFSRTCIPRSWVCDDQEDCPDGEDETRRMCDNFNKFVFSSNILRPFGLGFEISAGF